jgi:hypothetical protein
VSGSSRTIAGWAQPATITTAGGAMRLQAPEFGILEGEILDRLRDGRSVRLDLALAVLTAPGGRPVAEARHSFNVSFDLWEERFAITRLGTPPHAVSHLELEQAEAWCVGQLTVPLSDLDSLASDTPFWIRLEYRVPDAEIARPDETDTMLTLRRLIEWLSRRAPGAAVGKSLEAGPFRLAG